MTSAVLRVRSVISFEFLATLLLAIASPLDGVQRSTVYADISAVSAIVIDPVTHTTVYAGTGGFGTGVFKSTNAGATWSAINIGLTTNGSLDVRALAMDPSNSKTLYVTGVTGMSTAKTTNGGAVWIPMNTSALTSGFAVVIDPSETATVYMAGPFGISKSTDAGLTWLEADLGIRDAFPLCLALDALAPKTLYAGTGNAAFGAVFRSSDGGASWSSLAGMPPPVYSLAVDPDDSRLIYAANDNGVYRSTDAGATWQLSLAAPVVRTLVMAPNPPLTVQALLENLTAAVAEMASPGGPLNFGQANSLLQKVEGAIQAVNGKGDKLACNHMRAFLNQVADLVRSRVLTAAQGGALTTQAQSVMQAIPCTRTRAASLASPARGRVARGRWRVVLFRRRPQ